MLDSYSSALSTPPGRVKSFLEGDNSKITPHSCVLRLYKNNLAEFLELLATDLCGGAGVKVNLDKFEPLAFNAKQLEWGFYLSPTHPDYYKITKSQLSYYIENPDDYYLITVKDSMKGFGGIVESWGYFITALNAGKKVCVDLSNLRPAGFVNDKKLQASGAVGNGDPNECSFFSIYKVIADHLKYGDICSFVILLGTLNDTLRRGGYKRGIICTSLDYRHENIDEYLEFDNALVPGGHKKAVRLDRGLLDYPKLMERIAYTAEKESTFLEKIKPDRPDLYANVCEGLAIPDGGICLLWRINLGLITDPEQIIYAFKYASEDLIDLHLSWRDKFNGDLSHIPTLREDKQVGLDLLGLGSMLANFGVTYKEFTESLNDFLLSEALTYPFVPSESVSNTLVHYLYLGYNLAINVARSKCNALGLPELERIFTIEPSQRHFTDCLDANGYTSTRSIFPPFERTQRRSSDHDQEKVYKHNPKIEIASDVGAKEIFDFACAFKRFLDFVGYSHGYMSFDSFEPIDSNWIKQFINSPLESKYYSESSRFDQTFLKKDSAVCELGRADECLVCAE